MKESHFLQVPNDSDNNLREYLGQKLEALLALRPQNAGDLYKPEDIEDSMKYFELYINAKTDTRDDIGITEYSKKSFEELVLNWEVLKPEFKAVILEDCFTNPNESSEQFLFMRDRYISKKGNVFFHCNSSRFREHFIDSDDFEGATPESIEHLILSNEIDDDVVKGYCALRRLKQIGIFNEGLENLVRRDMVINKGKTYVNRNLVGSEKDTSEERAYINSLFRIASNIDALLYLVSQEEDKDKEHRYLDRDTVIRNIKEAASDAPYVKSLLSTSIDQLVSRANFIRWQDEQTAPGGALEGERVLFNNKGLVDMLTMPNSTFCRLFDYEIQLAEDHSVYRIDDKMMLSFRKIYEANLAMCQNYEERIDLNKNFHSIFLSYDFGSPSDYCEEKINEYYEKAYNYYKDLESELKRVRREEERKDKQIFDTSDRNNGDEPRTHREHDPDNAKPRTFDEDKVDEFIAKVAKAGIKCIKTIPVSDIGTPDTGNSAVIYYVFKKDDVKDIYIWEPIGQPGNATLIFKTSQGIDEFAKSLADENAERIRNNEERLSIDQLVREKRVYRMGHSGGSFYEPGRLVTDFEMIEHSNSDKTVSSIIRDSKLDQLEEERFGLNEYRIRGITKIPSSEVGTMADYIGLITGGKDVERYPEKKKAKKKREKVEDLEKRAGAKVGTFKKLKENIDKINSDKEK